MNWVTGRVVKNAVKSKVFPVPAMKAYVGSRGIPPLILNLGISISRLLPPSPSPGKNPAIYRMWGWMGNPWVGLAVLVIKPRTVMYKSASTFALQFCAHYSNTRRHIPEENYLDISILFSLSLQSRLQESQHNSTTHSNYNLEAIQPLTHNANINSAVQGNTD
jgi:hypothetical protein